MSFLQTLISNIKKNVDKFEAELARADSTPLDVFSENQHPYLDDPKNLISPKSFLLLEKIKVDLKAVDCAITPARYKLVELAAAQSRASALHAALELGISDAIEENGGKANLETLSKKLQVNENKLARVIRTLASDFIFVESSEGSFQNTRLSSSLRKKEKSHHFLSLISKENSMSATGLTESMTNPKTRHSFAAKDAPFCSTVSNGETFEEYLMDSKNVEVTVKVIEGVVPWLNQITRKALLEDYPWTELGKATVIDVGCGPGDSGFDIMRANPGLHWVFQDLEPQIESLKKSMLSEFSEKVQSGSIQFVVQDYFQDNASVGDVWYLRGIIREYDDDDALKVLKKIEAKMRQRPDPRMLINEILCPAPFVGPPRILNKSNIPSQMIPEEQSALAEISNLMTWTTYHFFGGKERSFPETRMLLEAAGLGIVRFFRFRSFTTIIECKSKSNKLV